MLNQLSPNMMYIEYNIYSDFLIPNDIIGPGLNNSSQMLEQQSLDFKTHVYASLDLSPLLIMPLS